MNELPSESQEQNNLRLFLGIPLSSEVISNINLFKSQNEHLNHLKWVVEKNLHITVCFFGNTPEEMLENLHALIGLSLQKQSAFELRFDRYMFGPSKKEKRMVWCRLKKNASFRQLVLSVVHLYQQINPSFQQRKSPIPHITLARIKKTDIIDTSQLFLHHSPLLEKLYVDHLILWKSTLTPKGSIYEVVHTYSLSK